MREMRRSLAWAAATAAAILLFVAVPPSLSQRDTRPVLIGGEVHGLVAVEFKQRNGAVRVRLPRARVFLRHAASGALFGPTFTDAHGWFATDKVEKGRYHVCAETDTIPRRCDQATVSLSTDAVVLKDDFLLFPAKRSIHGSVLLGDGSACYAEDWAFRPVIMTKITLADAESRRAIGESVLANSSGGYVIADPPDEGRFVLQASCDDSAAERPFVMGTNISGGFTPVSITFANRRPRFISIDTADSGGARVRHATPGQTVRVTAVANDVDGDSLHYRWSAGSGAVSEADARSVEWRLPNVEGTATVFVRIDDGNGGFARGSASVFITRNPQVPFSGTVVDRTTSSPVANADVSVNGVSVKSASNGRFYFTVKPNPRYVLNARKDGYALTSLIYADSATQTDVFLDRATRVTCDPAKKCDVVATIGPKCDDRTKRATLSIPAGALVGPNGKSATVPVRVDFAAYDLSQTDAIPGTPELFARDGNRELGLTSYGAVNIDATDASGRRYNLAANKPATISLPAQGANPPGQIELWRYEEKDGTWIRRGGTGRLSGGGAYQFSIPSFSAWNTDLSKVIGSCIGIVVDEATTSYPMKVVFKIPAVGPGVTKTFTVTGKENLIRRLPPNTAITMEVHPKFGPDAVIKTYNLNSGPQVANNLTTNYTDCLGFDADLSLGDPGYNPVIISLPLPTYSGDYLSRKGPFAVSDPVFEAKLYYQNLGTGITFADASPTFNPNLGSNRATLASFKTLNGFPTNEAVAHYYNAGDLGLGRQMHCRAAGGGRVACYVSNFGTGAGGDADVAVTDAVNNTLSGIPGPIATVAMEYDPPTGGVNSIKFYVYDGAGNIAPQAVLDSQGPKPVPYICLVCHGGNYDEPTHNVDGNATFREFDIFTFLYHPTNATYQLTAQQPQFRRLNELVRSTDPRVPPFNTHDPIRKLIDGMYSPKPVSDVTAVATDNYVPPGPGPTGWDPNPTLYTAVPRVFCRACHIAQYEGLDWTAYDQMNTDFKGSIQFSVCTAGNHQMPHAEVPFKKFWQSGAPQALASGISLGGGCPP